MGSGGERMRRIPSELAMCSTCSGFVLRKERVMDPDEEVVEVVTEAGKMRDLIRAVCVDGLLQLKEPAEATMEQWRVLRRRRLLMMETKKCPACSRLLSEKPGPIEEDKAAGSKEKKKKDKAAGSKEKKRKAKSDVMEASGSKKKARRSSETEGSGSKEAEMEDTESLKETEGSESAGRNGKTKMVTMRVYKKSLDILRSRPPLKPSTFTTCDAWMKDMLAWDKARYEVDCEFRQNLYLQYLIQGYAEYQLEVTDDEDE